jgi:DNA polymerase III sliding clamp (beta) subunit (PCNA family)
MTVRPLFRFEISGSELRRAAGWLEKLAIGRVQAGAEHLSGVLLRADLAAMQVSFSATDLQMYGVSLADTKVHESGQAVVSANLLWQIAKTCKTDEVLTFEQTASYVDVSAGSASWRLPRITDDYWQPWTMRGEMLAEVETVEFARACTRVKPAVDKEVIKPFWGGLALGISPARVTVCATDGFRVALAHVPAQTFVDDAELWVPESCVARSLAGAQTGATLAINRTPEHTTDEGAIFSGPGFRARSRLLTEYALWRKTETLIAQTGHSRVVLDVKEALGAIARIGFLVQEGAPLRMEIGDEDVTFSVAEEDNVKGSGASACSADVSEIHHESVVFRAGYLDDLLKGVDAPTAEIVFGPKPFNPVVAYPLDVEGNRVGDYLHMVKPINLSLRKR